MNKDEYIKSLEINNRKFITMVEELEKILEQYRDIHYVLNNLLQGSQPQIDNLST